LRLEYARANARAAGDAARGQGPDTNVARAENGVHAVANIPSVHIPAFVRLSLNGDAAPYKNGYDLERFRIGDSARPPGRREVVDVALPAGPPEKLYFCAVELNGPGLGFYGDVCLVLRQERIVADTVVLDRNSFDLERSPIADRFRYAPENERHRARTAYARAWSGRWGTDLSDMIQSRVIEALGGGTRRVTTGQISDVLLDDEDYMEVLLLNSFAAKDIQEARVSAADAALDAQIADRMQRGPVPSFAALRYRHLRRRAESELRRVGVATKVVTTTGRKRT
jgi:hypothetical protein